MSIQTSATPNSHAGCFRAEEPAEALVDRADSDTPPWLAYALGKALLARGRVDETVRLINLAFEDGGHDVTVLNLLARYLAHQGRTAEARKSIETSLEVNPHQDDLAALRGGLDAGGACPAPYLDPLPRHFPLSFYLPVYNVEAHIQDTVEGLLDQRYPVDDLIIVDDGSTDRSLELAKRYPVTVLTHPENRGLAAARNTAFQHAGHALPRCASIPMPCLRRTTRTTS